MMAIKNKVKIKNNQKLFLSFKNFGYTFIKNNSILHKTNMNMGIRHGLFNEKLAVPYYYEKNI